MEADQALYQLAAYDVARGLIMIPESTDQAIGMQKGIAKRFNYFKRLIQNSELSFEDIHQAVIERNGPFPSKKHNMSLDDLLESLKEPEDKVSTDKLHSVLHKLFADILQITGQQPKLIDGSSENDELPPLPLDVLDELEETEDTEEMDDFNPSLYLKKTDTPIDSNTTNRVLPMKGKDGRIKKSNKPKPTKKTENEEDS